MNKEDIRRLLEETEDIEEVLNKLEESDINKSLSIWYNIYSKGEIFNLIRSRTEFEDVIAVTEWISYKEALNNNWYYRDSADNFYIARDYDDLIRDEIEREFEINE